MDVESNSPRNETALEVNHSEDTSRKRPGIRKGYRFWLVILALLVSLFLAVLESFAFSTALPTVVANFHATQFIWVANAYAIPAAAILPLSGGLAEIFGRSPVMLGSLLFFSIGSAIGGAAQSMNMLIAARALQGVGAGGIFSLTSIIMSDLVSLEERGIYGGLFGMTFALSGGIGPIVGGALSHHTTWRWLLYLNIPIAGVAALLVIIFLSLPKPPGSLYEKFMKIDWIGNILVIGSTCSCVISLTWGGVVYPWSSPRVLTPLCLGIAGLLCFLIYEVRWCSFPMVSKLPDGTYYFGVQSHEHKRVSANIFLFFCSR